MNQSADKLLDLVNRLTGKQCCQAVTVKDLIRNGGKEWGEYRTFI